MGIKCCHPCVPPKRHPGCHDTCPEYLKEKAQDRAEKEAIRKIRDLDHAIMEQRGRSVRRAIKKRKIPPRR